MKASILKWSLVLLLAVTATWDLRVHRNALAATANRKPYERSKYFTKGARSPFVFVSRYTLTDASLDHEIRMESTEAADLKGRSYWETHIFNPSTDGRATYDSAGLVDTSTGKIISGFSRSRAEEDAGAPLMVVFGQGRKLVREHTLPENNCTAPEPHLKFLRYELLTIGGVSYPTAVLHDREDNNFETTVWLSMTPGLGCLELKSVANYTNQENVKGTTIHEPVSLTLGEPKSSLTDIAGRIANREVEMVPIENWDAAIKAAAKKYQGLP